MNLPRRCRECPCRICWTLLGLDRVRCDGCAHSWCPQRGTFAECERWLLDGVMEGDVLVVEEGF